MLPQPSLRFYLPENGLAALIKGFSGKLTLNRSLGASVPFILWDTFDGTLRLSNRMLLEASHSFSLISPDGTILQQQAHRSSNFVADFPPGPIKTALIDLSQLRCLLPQAEGQIEEGRLVLVDDQGKTCARAHLHVLTTARGRGALITLQGLRGYDKALVTLREHLTENSARPMIEIRDALFAGQPPYSAKPEVELGPDETAFDAATQIIAAYLPVLRANEPGIIADYDTEFLHDYRIGLRKIRLILGLFNGVYRSDRTEALRIRFAGLMQATGPLRDLDVALLDRASAYARLPPSLYPGLDALFAILGQERLAAHRTLAALLQTAAYHEEVKSLTNLFHKPRHLSPGKLADIPAQVLAQRLIRARHQKICDLAAKITPETPDTDLHLLRLHLKKLRYLMEFFAHIFPLLPFKTLRKAIKSLQDLLGQFNDGSVQQVSLDEFLSRHPAAPVAMAQSVGALMAVLYGRHGGARAAALTALQAFTGPEMCATFHSMVSATKEAS
jgi:CHAD domain-containing protein